MITIHKVGWQNFLSTGNLLTEIRLDVEKTTLIAGDNGSGKSTIMDALTYSLFGKPFRKINKPQLINSTTNKNMLVEVSFTTNNRHYIVKRGMKPNVFEIYQDQTLINQDADSRDYQKHLEQSILKMTYKTFCQIVVLGHANFTPFMQLPAAQRREIIEDLLDIQVFSIMNTLLKTKMFENKQEFEECEQAIKLKKNTIELKKKHERELEKNNDFVIQETTKKIEELQTNLHERQHAMEQLEIQRNPLQDRIVGFRKIETKLSDAHVLQKRIESSRKNLLKQKDFFESNNTCPTCSQDIDGVFKQSKILRIESRYSDLQSKDDLLGEQIRQLTDKAEEKAKIEKEIQSLAKGSASILAEIQLIQTYIKELNSTIKKLQIKKANDNISEEIEILENDLVKLNDRKAQLLDQREIYNISLMLLKDQGIKSQIINQYIPVMNRLINNYLDQMDFFCQFELDETFNEKILSHYCDEFSYDSFSQGEKMRIDLSLLFSWREIARLRNSASVNILILDEIMDSSLDSQGTDEFTKIVKALSDQSNIIVISHKHDLIADKFDKTIKFAKVQNFSRITE